MFGIWFLVQAGAGIAHVMNGELTAAASQRGLERAQAGGGTLLAAGAPRARAAYVEPAIWVWSPPRIPRESYRNRPLAGDSWMRPGS